MTDETTTDGVSPETQTIELVAKHSLEVTRGRTDNVLRVFSPDGQAKLSIVITSQGISLQVTGGDLILDTTGTVNIGAEQICLHGRQGVEIVSGGDASIRAVGDIHSEAREQNIKAKLGNVNIKANDDVKLNGEQIKLNV